MKLLEGGDDVDIRAFKSYLQGKDRWKHKGHVERMSQGLIEGLKTFELR